MKSPHNDIQESIPSKTPVSVQISVFIPPFPSALPGIGMSNCSTTYRSWLRDVRHGWKLTPSALMPSSSESTPVYGCAMSTSMSKIWVGVSTL